MIHIQLTQPVICHPHVTRPIQKYIIQLQIAIDDIASVEELQRQNHFDGVEARHVRRKHAPPLDERHEIAPDDVVHDEHDGAVGGEARVQRDQERVVGVGAELEHSALVAQGVHLFVDEGGVFFDHFYGDGGVGGSGLGEKDLAKVSAA